MESLAPRCIEVCVKLTKTVALWCCLDDANLKSVTAADFSLRRFTFFFAVWDSSKRRGSKLGVLLIFKHQGVLEPLSTVNKNPMSISKLNC